MIAWLNSWHTRVKFITKDPRHYTAVVHNTCLVGLHSVFDDFTVDAVTPAVKCACVTWTYIGYIQRSVKATSRVQFMLLLGNNDDFLSTACVASVSANKDVGIIGDRYALGSLLDNPGLLYLCSPKIKLSYYGIGNVYVSSRNHKILSEISFLGPTSSSTNQRLLLSVAKYEKIGEFLAVALPEWIVFVYTSAIVKHIIRAKINAFSFYKHTWREHSHRPTHRS